MINAALTEDIRDNIKHLYSRLLPSQSHPLPQFLTYMISSNHPSESTWSCLLNWLKSAFGHANPYDPFCWQAESAAPNEPLPPKRGRPSKSKNTYKPPEVMVSKRFLDSFLLSSWAKTITRQFAFCSAITLFSSATLNFNRFFEQGKR